VSWESAFERLRLSQAQAEGGDPPEENDEPSEGGKPPEGQDEDKDARASRGGNPREDENEGACDASVVSLAGGDSTTKVPLSLPLLLLNSSASLLCQRDLVGWRRAR
jgi:hypothetical protein